MVSNLGKSGQYNGQYTDFFLQTTVVITGSITKSSNFDLLPSPKLAILGELPTPYLLDPPTERRVNHDDLLNGNLQKSVPVQVIATKGKKDCKVMSDDL